MKNHTQYVGLSVRRFNKVVQDWKLKQKRVRYGCAGEFIGTRSTMLIAGRDITIVNR